MRMMLSTSIIFSHLSSLTCISGNTLRVVNLWWYASEYVRHKWRNSAMWSQFQFWWRRRTSASRTQVYAKCHLHQQTSFLSKNFAIKALQQKTYREDYVLWAISITLPIVELRLRNTQLIYLCGIRRQGINTANTTPCHCAQGGVSFSHFYLHNVIPWNSS